MKKEIAKKPYIVLYFMIGFFFLSIFPPLILFLYLHSYISLFCIKYAICSF